MGHRSFTAALFRLHFAVARVLAVAASCSAQLEERKGTWQFGWCGMAWVSNLGPCKAQPLEGHVVGLVFAANRTCTNLRAPKRLLAGVEH